MKPVWQNVIKVLEFSTFCTYFQALCFKKNFYFLNDSDNTDNVLNFSLSNINTYQVKDYFNKLSANFKQIVILLSNIKLIKQKHTI